ncbi:MAG TPA: GNAT family N-acetyltransferase [Ruminococcaceae bacterium]|nr:GNAT family N-acetyltransferase [Oscillospiraceae bacterium]
MFIRNLKISDYDEVYKLWSRTEGICLCYSSDSLAAIERFLLRNPNTCFVAEAAGRIAGVVLCGHDGRCGSIYHMAVDNAHRSSGVGKALFEAAANALKSEGIHNISISVLKSNEDAIKFWQAEGFTLNSDTVSMKYTVTGGC